MDCLESLGVLFGALPSDAHDGANHAGARARLKCEDLTAKKNAGEMITPPGLPLPESERAAFVTADCIRVAEPR